MPEKQTEKDRLMAKRRAASAAAQLARQTDETASRPAFVEQQAENIVHRTIATAPPIRNGSAIMLPQIDKSREITERDVTIPRLQIAQSMSKVVQDGIVPLGSWYHTGRNRDLGKEVSIIPADMQKTRSYFVQGAGVMCRSFDFVTGEGTPGGLCEGTVEEQSTLGGAAGCPLRHWGERDPKTNRSSPPPCGENYNFAVIVIEDPTDPDSRLLRGILTFRKTGIAAAKNIITMKVEEDYDWWDMVIKVRLTEKTNSLGRFQVPEVEFEAESTKYPAARARAIKLSRVVNSALVRATLEADPE